MMYLVGQSHCGPDFGLDTKGSTVYYGPERVIHLLQAGNGNSLTANT